MCASIFTSRLSNAAQASGEQHVAHQLHSAEEDDQRESALTDLRSLAGEAPDLPVEFHRVNHLFGSEPARDLARRDGDLRHLLGGAERPQSSAVTGPTKVICKVERPMIQHAACLPDMLF